MKITMVGRQMTVPEDLKALVEKKLAKLDKYFYDEGDATVTFSRKHNKERLEVTISASNTLFRAEDEEEKFRDALDRDIDAIERQIRKFKTRLGKRIRQNAVEKDVSVEPIPEEKEFDIRSICKHICYLFSVNIVLFNELRQIYLSFQAVRGAFFKKLFCLRAHFRKAHCLG